MEKTGIFILLLIIFEILNFSGFSYWKMRWLSDREMILIAADNQAKRAKGEIRYSSGQALLDANPACCKVRGFGKLSTQNFAILLGWYVASVEGVYRISYAAKDQYYYFDTSVSSSGTILESMGMESGPEG